MALYNGLGECVDDISYSCLDVDQENTSAVFLNIFFLMSEQYYLKYNTGTLIATYLTSNFEIDTKGHTSSFK